MLSWCFASADDEGSGRGKKVSKCGNCKFGAECDEDSEDMLWVNIKYYSDLCLAVFHTLT